MKKITVSLVALLLIGSSTLFSALPPLYSSIDEFQGLLKDPQLGQKLDSAQMIRSITKTSNGFILRTQQYKLEVTTEPKPKPYPGPISWSYTFHELVPLTPEEKANDRIDF